MESDTVEKIREKFRTLEPEDQEKVLEFVERLSVETAQGDTSMQVLSALSLYNARQDKGYSLTDCMSMSTMRELGITNVLTHDRHFTQEGFNVLL